MEKIKAMFSYPVFENDKGYCIYLYKEEVSGKKITCTGNYLPKYQNLKYELTGTWKKTDKYGMNFQVESYDEVITTTREGIVTYLSSGMITGIGKKIAEKIYDIFGEMSIQILEEEPEKLKLVKGITDKKLEKIKDSYAQNHCMRKLTEFLYPYGITTKQVVKIYNELGFHDIETIKKNLYDIVKIHGITVETADIIAKKVGYPLDCPKRLKAHTYHVLYENEALGNTGMEADDFGYALLASLRTPCYTKKNICSYVIKMIQQGILCYKNYPCENGIRTIIYRPHLYKLEETLAKNLIHLSKAEQEKHTNALTKILERCNELHITLDHDQKQALITAINSSVMFLVGGPGTGKTTLIKLLAWYLEQEEPNREIYFMAPSGRAARRITESSGYPATTIHKFLKIRPGETTEEKEEELIYEDATLIVDEFSMVDVALAQMLVSSIQHGCRLIFIGDPNQLQSVGAGAVLRDVLNSDVLTVARLTQIHRQSEDSMIYENAQKVIKGNHDIKEGIDFKIIQSHSPEEAQEKMIASFLRYTKERGLKHIYCLCPCKERAAGVKIMNNILQEKINPATEGCMEVSAFGLKFRVGDPVMHLKNGEEVSNGDIGYVTKIKENASGELCMFVTYFGDVIIEYRPDDMEDVTLAYAMTVHKAQGSENNVVITFLSNSLGRKMLKRNLVNTSITRGHGIVELYLTEDNALDYAIDNDDSKNRITSLQYHLELHAGRFVRVS